jgi:hypothetical protein
MKPSRIVRCLPWLLIALCPALLGHCGGAVEHGTETGNPPVIEQQKLHVVLHDDGVVVVGDPGAVNPGATVTVINVGSSARSETTAGSDGSVSVSVPGTLDDEYEVTVSSGGRSQTVRVSANSSATGTAGTGGASGDQLASASCDSLEQTLNAEVTAGFASASKACQADSDCTTGGDVGCYYACGGPVLSRAGAQAAQQSLLESTAPICAELSSRCPGRGPPGCPFSFNTLACNDGTCGQLSCGGLELRAQQQLNDLMVDRPRDCTRDEDCSMVEIQVRCVGGCGINYQSVQAGREAEFTARVQNIDANFCEEFVERPCRVAPTPCAQPAPTTARVLACVAGRCEINYVPVP